MMTNFSKISRQLSREYPGQLSSDSGDAGGHRQHYKCYPRMPLLNLGKEPVPSSDLFVAIQNRQSRHDFIGKSLAVSELSLLLQYSCGQASGHEKITSSRAQPSAGAFFPIEVYPIIFRGSDNLPTGVYHYNIKSHGLDVLCPRGFKDEEIHALSTQRWIKNATAIIVLTVIFERSQDVYGERGYRYALLESGHIGQNVYLVAEALGLRCCALGETHDENIEKLIDLDGISESLIYALAIGK